MKFVSRGEWGARPRLSTPTGINSEGTTVHWEGPGLWRGVIGDHASCAPKVRAIQSFHMVQRGWTDIAYNALVCPHGFVFEGRGPGKRSAANGTNVSNGRSAVVCYLGGSGDPFTAEAKQGVLDAAAYLLGDVTWGHRDWHSTDCPGDDIYSWVHSGHHSTPVLQVGVDMTVGQCRDKAPANADGGPNRKWFFYVGEDMALWARVPTSKVAYARLGGIWTSGVQAFCEEDGRIVISGRASDGQVQQCIVYTDGNTVKPAGTAPDFQLLGGEVYPPN